MKLLLIALLSCGAKVTCCQYTGMYGSTEHLEHTIQQRNDQIASAAIRIHQVLQQPKPAPYHTLSISTPTSPRDTLKRSQ